MGFIGDGLEISQAWLGVFRIRLGDFWISWELSAEFSGLTREVEVENFSGPFWGILNLVWGILVLVWGVLVLVEGFSV